MSVSLFALAFAPLLFAERSVPVRRLPDVSLRALAAQTGVPPMVRETRHAEKRVIRPEFPGRGGQTILPGRQQSGHAGLPLLQAPRVALGFAGHSTRLVSPADASGAVGPHHLAGMSNGGMTVHDRRGTALAKVWINQFWADNNNSNEYYDPRIAYDEANDRWITAAIFEEQSIMIAVTTTGDPLGTWKRYRLDLRNVDFTRIAVTKNAVAISTTHFVGDSIGDHGTMLVLPKRALYSDLTSADVVPYTVRSGAVPVEAPESNVIYTAEAGDSEIVIRRLDRRDAPPVRVDAGFQWEYSWMHLAPQLGTSIRIDTGYQEAVAMMRGGALYVVHKVGFLASSGERSSIVWWKIDPVRGTRLDIGLIDDPTGATDYAYPSIAVNRSGAALIAYSTFSALQFPSSGYVYRDPAGRVSAPAVLKAGDTAATITERWGDYTTTVVDPLNGTDFWATTIYGFDATWGTWWANVKVPPGKSRSVRK